VAAAAAAPPCRPWAVAGSKAPDRGQGGEEPSCWRGAARGRLRGGDRRVSASASTAAICSISWASEEEEKANSARPTR
jgi:hypothetical protein